MVRKSTLHLGPVLKYFARVNKEMVKKLSWLSTNNKELWKQTFRTYMNCLQCLPIYFETIFSECHVFLWTLTYCSINISLFLIHFFKVLTHNKRCCRNCKDFVRVKDKCRKFIYVIHIPNNISTEPFLPGFSCLMAALTHIVSYYPQLWYVVE